MKNLVEELQWRGMVQDIMPGTEEQLLKEMTTAYVGFDPTSDSLHIGNLVPIILLVHVSKCGHKPIALVGGATGMIGDPSGKSDERNLLDEVALEKNVAGIKAVLSRFLDFNSTAPNAPILVNNYDWMKEFSFIAFARDVGKRITVNYMMAKDSVKKRFAGDGPGMSFTEFTYQLIQGYDFYHLHKEYNCLLQMGGSDQWGNITTGTELVRRMNGEGAKAYAMTCPLITKADGSKFGKSEGGNVWLTADKTSVYKFYQFWLNTTDVDAEKYIKIFTFLDKNTIDSIIAEHQTAPHLRVLQKRLAEEITTFVHGKEELEKAIKASNILFGNATIDDLKQLDDNTFLEVFDEFPKAEISKNDVEAGIDIVTILNDKTGFMKSKSEARRALVENSVSVNRGKVSEGFRLTSNDLINNKFVLLQRGKKNYFIVSLKNEVAKSLTNTKLHRGSKKTKIKSPISKIENSALISKFTALAEKRYYNEYGNRNLVALPISENKIQKQKSYILETKVDGEKYSIPCAVIFSSRLKKISLSKSARKMSGLRMNDKVDYVVDLIKNKIIIEVK